MGLYSYGLKNLSAKLGKTYFYVNFTVGKPSVKLLLQTAVTVFAEIRFYGYGTVFRHSTTRSLRQDINPSLLPGAFVQFSMELCMHRDIDMAWMLSYL
jgi:hypothetical protein